jgi:hypothetical protein
MASLSQAIALPAEQLVLEPVLQVWPAIANDASFL